MRCDTTLIKYQMPYVLFYMICCQVHSEIMSYLHIKDAAAFKSAEKGKPMVRLTLVNWKPDGIKNKSERIIDWWLNDPHFQDSQHAFVPDEEPTCT